MRKLSVKSIEAKIELLKFMQKHLHLCRAAFNNGYAHKDFKSQPGQMLVQIAREELHYDKTTYSGDIYYIIGKMYSDLIVEGEKEYCDEANKARKARISFESFVENYIPDLSGMKFHTVYIDDMMKVVKVECEGAFNKASETGRHWTTESMADLREMNPIHHKRPPIGLKPRRLHDMDRFEEICLAIQRYKEEGQRVPIEWHLEYNHYVNDHGYNDVHKIAHMKVTDRSEERIQAIANAIKSIFSEAGENQIKILARMINNL